MIEMSLKESELKRRKIVQTKEELSLSSLTVAIVGGGLGGLAVALALQDIGISCKVYEKDRYNLYFI